MRVPLVCVCAVAALLLAVAGARPAPAHTSLQTGDTEVEHQPFVEEVVVESILQVRSPSQRQARTNARTNLQDGTRVAEAKN